MKKLFLLLLVMLSLFSAQAEEGYQFKSDLEFKHDSSIVAGQLENYSLYTNENVKLLIAFLEDKNFLDEIGKMSDADIKENFYSKARFYDPLNNQTKRTMTSFKITKNNLFTKVEMEYSLLKNDMEWRESNVYVLGPKSTVFAALQFPENLSQSEQLELKKGMHDFSLQDDKVVESSVKIFDKITFESLTALSAKKISNLLSLGSFIVSDSFAEEAKKETGCDTAKYIAKGEFSTKKGSAIFNFQKLSNDIQVEASKENPSDKELTCLSNFYKRAKNDAATYWSERGVREGCLGSDGQPLPKKQKTCSDSTYNEMTASFKYIDNVDKSLNDVLVGKVTSQATCDIKQPEVSEQMKVFAKMNSDFQQTFCCSNGTGTLDKGPLFTILEGEDTFKKLSPTAQTEMCLLKTRTENKSFASPTGMVDCLSGMIDGIANVAKSLLKTIVSVFDGELIKALGQFIANLPDSAVNMVKTVGEHIATQVYGVTNCMSPYEKNIYMCKITPNVVSMLMGPGLVKNFMKALVDKTGKTALAQVIVSAAKNNKQFQQMQAASAAVAAGGRKVASSAMKVKAVRMSAAALGRVAAILGKDISTPFNNMVAKKARAAIDAASLKTKSVAEKVLRRKKVVIEDVDVDLPASTPALAAVDAAPVAAVEVAPATVAAEVAPTTATISTAPAKAASSANESLTLTSSEPPIRSLSTNAHNVLDTMEDYKKAVTAGNASEAATLKKQMHENSKLLSDEERVVVAKAWTGKSLKEKGIVDAHEVGGPGRELGSYNQSELRLKARKAQRAGVNKEHRRDLMEAGVLGGDSAAAVPKFISIQTPAGRIAARVVESTGDSHVIEYMGVNGKLSFKKTVTTEQLNSMGMRASETSEAFFQKLDAANPNAAAAVPAKPTPADLNSVFADIEREGRERMAASAAKAQQELKLTTNSSPTTASPSQGAIKVSEAQEAAISKGSFKIKNEGTNNLREGGLDKQALSALDDFTSGTHAQTAKKLAVELKSLDEAQFLKKMDKLVEENSAKKVVVKLGDQDMVRYEFPDGSMVRYMPEGDTIRKGPTYVVEVNKDILPDVGDPSHTAFKLNSAGEPIPRTPRDIQLPSNVLPNTPEAEAFIKSVMDQGHVKLASPATPKVVEAVPEKPKVSTYPERVDSAQKPDYVNSYGVAKADINPGNTIKAKVNTIDGVKEIEGELINGIHLNSSGMPSVQVRYADGVITDVGSVMRGKPNYKIELVEIDRIEALKLKQALPETKIIPAEVKPINKTVKQPSAKEMDPTSYDGKRFRTQADTDALNTLLKDQRVGERFHISELEKEISSDNIVRSKSFSSNRDINKASKHGDFNNPNFDPKIYYADLAEEFNAASTAANKFSPNGISAEAAEVRLKGRITYGADGKPMRVGSARDELKQVMAKKGKTPEQIKEMEDWMDSYDATIPRKNVVEKAKAAQAAFEKMKPKLEAILAGEKQILAQSTFEEMSASLKNMALKAEKKEAAEAALRRIKCSRPEWKISDTHNGFDLKCH